MTTITIKDPRDPQEAKTMLKFALAFARDFSPDEYEGAVGYTTRREKAYICQWVGGDVCVSPTNA